MRQNEICPHGIPMSAPYCADCRLIYLKKHLEWFEALVSDCRVAIAQIEEEKQNEKRVHPVGDN
jgi:hypothetical protein